MSYWRETVTDALETAEVLTTDEQRDALVDMIESAARKERENLLTEIHKLQAEIRKLQAWNTA